MSQLFLKTEITDIYDEMSEDLRRELTENQTICVSKLKTNENPLISELIIELKDENKRLKSDLMFADNCLKSFDEFNEYLNEIRPKIENVLDFKEKQKLYDFEIQYKLMIKKFDERKRRNEEKGIDLMDKQSVDVIEDNREDHNYCNKEIESKDSLNIKVLENITSEEISPEIIEISDSSDVELIEEEISPEVIIPENLQNEDYISDNIVNVIEIRKRNENKRSEEPIIHPLIATNGQISGNSQLLIVKIPNQLKEIRPKTDSYKQFIKCSVIGCSAKFKTLAQMDKHLLCSRDHLKLRFNPNLKYECKECSFRSDSQNSLTLHYKQHIECGFCPKVCNNINELKGHVRANHSSHAFKLQFGCTFKEFRKTYRKKKRTGETIRRNRPKEGTVLAVPLIDKSYLPHLPEKRVRKALKEHHYKKDNQNNYLCDRVGCKYKHHNFDTLRLHIRSKHRIFHKCDECDTKTHTLEMLRMHKMDRHSNMRINCNCDLCRPPIPLNDNQNKKTLEENPPSFVGLWEDYSKFITNSLTNLINNKQNDMTQQKVLNPKFNCDLCDFESTDLKMFFQHKKTHAMVNNGSTLPRLNCDLCTKSYKTKEDLTKHKRNIHSEEFKCQHCEHVFKSHTLRLYHIQKVHKDFPCKWPGCTFRAKIPCYFKRHMFIHTKQSEFSCDWPECDYMAKDKWSLKVHITRHTGERAYRCTWTQCDKSFSRSCHLQAHLRWHKKEMRYVCEWPGCQYKTYHSWNYSQHKKTHTKSVNTQ